jgi:hypothetical protein
MTLAAAVQGNEEAKGQDCNRFDFAPLLDHTGIYQLDGATEFEPLG